LWYVAASEENNLKYGAEIGTLKFRETGLAFFQKKGLTNKNQYATLDHINSKGAVDFWFTAPYFLFQKGCLQ